MGHIIDEKGIHPTDEKIRAIKDAKMPKNVGELQMFLGLFNYYIKFIKNSSTLLKPLHELLKKDHQWVWTSECEKTFEKCKNLLTSRSVLIHYDETKPLRLECDASPVGVGAILSHTMEDGTNKPIAYASRALSKAEKNYAQVEREALAIIFGLKKYEQYLYGRKFIIITDHKPLLSIFNPTSATPVLAAARLQRWSLLLAAHRYEIQYRQGQKHVNVDTLSRMPLEEKDLEKKNIFKTSYINDIPVSADDIRKETEKDKILCAVINYVKYGWKNEDKPGMQPFFVRREQLSINEGCLIWGFRVVIPKKYRNYVLELLHDTHPGIVRMKAVARSHLWWPGIDREIEQVARGCVSCIQQMNMPPSTPMQSWIWPRGPWERVHVDFAQKGQNYYLLVVDAHSKWLEVERMENITTKNTIRKLREMIARYGLPKELVSDNGPQLISQEFEDFIARNGIRHTLIPSYTPKCNGAAERCVQHFKNSLAKMDNDEGDNTNLDHKISRFLLMQRSTPHATTGKSPSELFIGRALRTRLSLIHYNVDDKVCRGQMKQKMQYDKSHGVHRNIELGKNVLYRDYTASPNKWSNGIVVDKEGTNTWKINTGKGTKLMHTDQIRMSHNMQDENMQGKVMDGDMDDQEETGNSDIYEEIKESSQESQIDNPKEKGLGETIDNIPIDVKKELSTVRRSGRVVKKVIKLNL